MIQGSKLQAASTTLSFSGFGLGCVSGRWWLEMGVQENGTMDLFLLPSQVCISPAAAADSWIDPG